MASGIPEEEVSQVLSDVLSEGGEVDEDVISYLAGMLSDGSEHPVSQLAQEPADGDDDDNDVVKEAIGPFLESSGCSDDLIGRACLAIRELAQKYAPRANSGTVKRGGGVSVGDDDGPKDATGGGGGGGGGAVKLKQGIVSMSSSLSATAAGDEDANRFLWGTEGTTVSYNESKEAYTDKTSAKEKRKARQELERARREYESKMRKLQEEEDAQKGAAVTAMVLPDYSKSNRGERDVQVRNVGLSLDSGRVLLDQAELRFAYQRRYGLVGKNGVGKTTLLKAIASLELEGFPRHLRVLHVRQEIRAEGDDVSVLQAVLQADVERMTLLQEEKELLQRLEGDGDGDEGAAGAGASLADKMEKLRKTAAAAVSEQKDASFDADLKRLDEVYGRLATLSSDSAESRAAMILSGLQFTPAMQTGPTSALSGGWRMRVSLAAALFIEPDLLMLDEPTNHLDLEAVLWLESYLKEYKHTVIVVSHDRGFLNEVCTDIIEFHKQKLTYYKGNYDMYVKTSEEQVRNSMRVYQAYQDKRAHLMEFIEKFRANAKRATLVQSRIKEVERMDAEAPAPVEVEPIWRFTIPNPEPLGRPILAVDDVTFDYRPGEGATRKPWSEYLLQDVNFGVDLTSRIGILGPNGAGKSTLLNLIMDRITPVRGSVSRNGRLRIGYFTQHSADKFDLELSSIENLLQMFDYDQDQEMRSFLGKFQIQGADAVKPMMMLSGGQKSRVAFAALAFQKPHVIVMDEPTNHLDMESIDALVGAIQNFQGGLMVVSHDQFFISNTCSELWVVGGGLATRFRGDFEDYKKLTLEKTAKRVAESVKSLSTINN